MTNQATVRSTGLVQVLVQVQILVYVRWRTDLQSELCSTNSSLSGFFVFFLFFFVFYCFVFFVFCGGFHRGKAAMKKAPRRKTKTRRSRRRRMRPTEWMQQKQQKRKTKQKENKISIISLFPRVFRCAVASL